MDSGFEALEIWQIHTSSSCLSKGLCDRYFSYMDPEIILNDELRHQIRDHKPTRGGITGPNWAGEWMSSDVTEQTPILLHRWMKESFPALHFDVEELIAIGEVLDDIGVWYDYTCMPQRPFMSEVEEQYFEWCLSRLSSLIASSHVLIIWDKESIDRGWCLYEGMVADGEGIANYDAIPNTNWKIAAFDLGNDYRGMHPSKQIALYLRQKREALVGKTLPEIRKFFNNNKIVCTHKEDVNAVCELTLNYFNQ